MYNKDDCSGLIKENNFKENLNATPPGSTVFQTACAVLWKTFQNVMETQNGVAPFLPPAAVLLACLMPFLICFPQTLWSWGHSLRWLWIVQQSDLFWELRAY